MVFFGMEYTKGLQEGSLDKRFLQAVVTLKHFAAYSLEGTWVGLDGKNVTRHNFDAKVSNFDWKDTYGEAFRKAIQDGGAKGVMCSYNAVNGVPTCASRELFDDLRKKWHFDG